MTPAARLLLRFGKFGKTTAFAAACCALTLLAGCFSITDKEQKPLNLTNTSAAKAAAQHKAQELKQKKTPPPPPDALGGVVSSDRWVVYQNKQEEEFEGNVHYDNGTYVFRSDYALSQRKQNLFSAKGNVFVRYNEPGGNVYELYADKVRYNYKTGQGRAQAGNKNRIKIVYTDGQGGAVTALARRADFDTQTAVYHLTGDVFVTYLDKEGKPATLKAQKMTARQKENYAVLQGDAEAENADYSLKAQTIEYDGQKGYSLAYGGRPLMRGKTQDGTFAIIADKVTTENATRKIKLTGRVEGWTVSEQINRSAANKSFQKPIVSME